MQCLQGRKVAESRMNTTNRELPETTRQAALSALVQDPLYRQAQAYPHCATDVLCEPKEFAQKIRLPEEAKRVLATALTEVSTVLLVSCWTSSKEPEPLSGGGKHFMFFVHPESLDLLYSAEGTWRA